MRRLKHETLHRRVSTSREEGILKLALALFILVLIMPRPARAQTSASKPLDKDQVMSLVTAGMDSEELAKRIADRGIDFDLADDYIQALRKAGAQDVVIKALRAVKPTPLNKEQVLKLAAAGVSGQRAVTLVKQRGIAFLPDEKHLETLRVAGADDALVAAVRAAGELRKGVLTLQVAATERSWVAVDADGKMVLQRVLGPGESETLQARETLEVTTGNALGIVLTLNGETLKPLGRRGEVKTIRLTASDVKMNSR